MKKTLAALAVLGAFAGSAFAADVTLYGLVDYGFSYQHVDVDDNAYDDVDTFKMKSGQNSGSRFGLKGTEDLGNGLTVGFVLENGFNADDGSISTDGKLFDRESSMFLQGNFGKLGFGRVGQLASSLGSYGLLGNVSPFSTGWGDFSGMKFVQATGHTRFDNTITYVTPSFAGFQVHAQYSFGNSDSDKGYTEGKATADRYYGIAASYKADNLYLVGIVDSMNWGSKQTTASARETDELDDQWTVTLGGNYNFGFMTTYAAFQYFDNAKSVGQNAFDEDGVGKANDIQFASGDEFFYNGAEGYSVALGLGVPCFGGTAKGHIGYVTAEDTKLSNNEFTRWNVTVGYDYNLSKRTSIYTAATYAKDTYKFDDAYDDGPDWEPSTVEVMAGLIHKF